MAMRNLINGGGKESLNSAQDINIIAGNQISIGDTVYTVSAPANQFPVNFDASVRVARLSPDGTKMVLGGLFYDQAQLYSVNGTTLTCISTIYVNNTTDRLSGELKDAAFSPDGKLLILVGLFTMGSGGANLYSIEGDSVTYLMTLHGAAGASMYNCYSVAFSPSGDSLVVGGTFTGGAKVYSVSTNSVSYVSEIYADSGTTKLSNTVYTLAYSPDGTRLVLGGSFTGRAKVYSVYGTTITYISDLYGDSGTTVLSASVYCTRFSPSGNMLVLTGAFTKYAKRYSVIDSVISFADNIYANAGTTALTNTVYAAKFNRDGTKFILGGYDNTYLGIAKLYSVVSGSFTFIQELYSDSGTTKFSAIVYDAEFLADSTGFVLTGDFLHYASSYSLSEDVASFVKNIRIIEGSLTVDNTVNSCMFSPDGSLLVLAGSMTGHAKLYSVSGPTLNYLSDIYGDASSTPLSADVKTIAFSPDGLFLVLGGAFSGKAKIYSVNTNSVTYLSEIYADNSNTVLSSTVNGAVFNHSGTKLILVGEFSSRAKIFAAVNGVVSYLSDIYSDNGSTLLSSTCYTADFSPDDCTIVIGGSFIGYCKIYSISGNIVTYISNVYSDNNSTPLSNATLICKFSPDGTKLVIGGVFSLYASIYSVAGTNLSYISAIYANTGTTSLLGIVRGIVFLDYGTRLILVGSLWKSAKLYIVSGNTVTYVSDLYGDKSTNILHEVINSVCIKSDNVTLVLGMVGGAQLYYTDLIHPVTQGQEFNIGYSAIEVPRSATHVGYSPETVSRGNQGVIVGISTIVD